MTVDSCRDSVPRRCCPELRRNEMPIGCQRCGSKKALKLDLAFFEDEPYSVFAANLGTHSSALAPLFFFWVTPHARLSRRSSDGRYHRPDPGARNLTT